MDNTTTSYNIQTVGVSNGDQLPASPAAPCESVRVYRPTGMSGHVLVALCFCQKFPFPWGVRPPTNTWSFGLHESTVVEADHAAQSRNRPHL